MKSNIQNNHTYERKCYGKVAGVTLIEMLIVMALLPMLLILVSQFFSTIIDSQERAVAQTAINQEQHYLLEKIAYDIGQSSAIITPAADGAIGPILQLQHGAAVVSYTTAAGKLVRTEGSTAIPITTSRVIVESFAAQAFANADGKDSVRLTFALSNTASAQLSLPTRTTTTTHTLR